MHITAFLSHRKLRISRPAYDSCLEAISRMTVSTDPFHDETHVFSILDSLDKFFDESREINCSQIDYEVLLQAVCWHDIWKSTKIQKSRRRVFFDNAADGLGSMRIFGRYARSVSLNPDTARKIKYAIRKHSSLQFLKRRTPESRLLYEMDTLEIWSIERLTKAIGYFGGLENISPKLFKIGKFYFDHWMAKKTGSKLHFEWSRQEFLNRKNRFFSDITLLVRDYARVWRHHPTASSVLREINENQASKNLKIILKGASKIKSNTNTRKLSLDTPRLNILPTATIGSKSISPREDPSSRGGLYE